MKTVSTLALTPVKIVLMTHSGLSSRITDDHRCHVNNRAPFVGKAGRFFDLAFRRNSMGSMGLSVQSDGPVLDTTRVYTHSSMGDIE